jgi:hypothetical protein
MGIAGIPASVEGGAPHPPPAASPPRRGDTSHGRRWPPSDPAYELPVRRCKAFAQKENLLQGYEVRRQRYLCSICTVHMYRGTYICLPTDVYKIHVHAPFRMDPLVTWNHISTIITRLPERFPTYCNKHLEPSFSPKSLLPN